MKVWILPIFVILLASSAQADWWDDFVEGVSSKISDGATFIKETAGPTIREKFDSIKATLQDPETHEKVQTWVKEDALPVIKEKVNQLSDFVNEEVAPELQKIYNAATEAHEKVFTDDNGEKVVKITRGDR
uniref:Uncharacterized protein n=1 Tax=Panagrolaimus sp. JU765 TaxID=591449 RepID=A0AC34QMR6_9BILA